jgi:hypothetical protein
LIQREFGGKIPPLITGFSGLIRLLENSFYWELRCDASKNSRLFEIALVFVRLDHVASFIINADHGVIRTVKNLAIGDRIADCV